MFAVFPILAQLYGATCLTKICRDSNYSWKKTAIIGMGVGAFFSLQWSLPYSQSCAGRDMYGGYDCERVEKEPTPFHEGFIVTTAVGLAAIASRVQYEKRD